MTALRVLPPSDYIGAVEAMDEIAAGVQRLVESGAGYRVPDAEYPDVYFDIATAPKFGYESRYDQATMLALSAERGGDPDRPGKRQPLDPLLWRMARPGEPSWESPMGPGRPGWHIECAVIAGNRLGPTIDVQGGGSDLIFPHHECSAAHAEVLTGVSPFARHYTPRRDDLARRREDVEVAGQPGVRVHPVGRRRRPDADPAGAAVGALPRRPPVVGGPARARRRPAGAVARAPRTGPATTRPRCSASCAGGSPTTSTPRARSAALDAWAADGSWRATGRRTPSMRCSASTCAADRVRTAGRPPHGDTTEAASAGSPRSPRLARGREDLADGIRRGTRGTRPGRVGERASYDELKMFGGLGLMVNTHMACGVMSAGVLVRVGPRGARRRHRPRRAGVRLHRPPDDRLRGRALELLADDVVLDGWVGIGRRRSRSRDRRSRRRSQRPRSGQPRRRPAGRSPILRASASAVDHDLSA